MAEQDDDDKTEEPTPRKLEQAREKGDIIYSPEVGAALSLIAATAIVAFMSRADRQRRWRTASSASSPCRISSRPILASLQAIDGQQSC